MLSLANYMMKLSHIKWYISAKDLPYVEDSFHVSFKAEDGYYLIETIRYSPYDILLALEEMDFHIKKEGEDIKIKILKI